MLAFLGFVVGLQELIRRAGPNEHALTTLFGFLGMVLVAVTWSRSHTRRGGFFGRTDSFRSHIGGIRAQEFCVIYGPVEPLLQRHSSPLLAPPCCALAVCPAWIGRAALASGVDCSRSVATFFSGTNPERFFSLNGSHLPILKEALWVLWIMCQRRASSSARASSACVTGGIQRLLELVYGNRVSAPPLPCRRTESLSERPSS